MSNVLAPLASHRAIDRVQSSFGRCPASQRNCQWRASFAACQTHERAITKKVRRAYRALYLGIQTFELSVASADDVPVWKLRRHERMSSSWLRHTERGVLRGITNIRRADRTDRGESLHVAKSSGILPPGYENASNCLTARFAPSTDAIGARANSEKHKTVPRTARRHCPRRGCTVVISETVVE